MRYRVAALLLLFLLPCILTAQRPIDIQHYRYEISLEDGTDTITGRATVSVKFLTQTDRLSLDLVSLKSGKGMIISGVSSTGKPVEAYHRNDSLVIPLQRKMQAGEEAVFIITYKGIPADGLIISKNKFGHRTFFADNWPNRARNWIPCVDDPADKASVEFIVTAPAHYQVVSNGLQVEETNLPGNKKLMHWKEEVPLPTKVMVIGVADFAVYAAGAIGCIPVTNWVFPENREQSFKDYAPATDILNFFSGYIAPYPYKKLANVQSKTIFGGMENASAIFYFENSVDGRQQQEGLIAHEIAHQWFGDMATEKSFAHLWLSEGFATYFTILYMEKKYGADTAALLRAEDRRQIIDFAKTSGKPVVDSISPYMSLLNANSYQKGGWILHMLRRELGDAVFQKGIQAYYTMYAGKNADTRDLQAVLEKVSGKNLAVFFQQWLYTPGIPRLTIQWSYSAADRKLNITITQLQPQAFQFPLDLLIQTSAGKKQPATLQVSQAVQSFSIPVRESPAIVTADPSANLLFEGIISEKK